MALLIMRGAGVTASALRWSVFEAAEPGGGGVE
jgi:hypothetical protein